jgi:hypothetical protein
LKGAPGRRGCARRTRRCPGRRRQRDPASRSLAVAVVLGPPENSPSRFTQRPSSWFSVKARSVRFAEPTSRVAEPSGSFANTALACMRPACSLTSLLGNASRSPASFLKTPAALKCWRSSAKTRVPGRRHPAGSAFASQDKLRVTSRGRRGGSHDGIRADAAPMRRRACPQRTTPVPSATSSYATDSTGSKSSCGSGARA